MGSELERYAGVLARWAENLPLKQIYIFGSRVRGDFTDASDLDVAVEFDPPATADQRMWNWQRENDTEFAALRQELGVQLSLHIDQDDSAWADIRAGAANPVFAIGKVLCVVTPARGSK